MVPDRGESDSIAKGGAYEIVSTMREASPAVRGRCAYFVGTLREECNAHAATEPALVHQITFSLSGIVSGSLTNERERERESMMHCCF